MSRTTKQKHYSIWYIVFTVFWALASSDVPCKLELVDFFPEEKIPLKPVEVSSNLIISVSIASSDLQISTNIEPQVQIFNLKIDRALNLLRNQDYNQVLTNPHNCDIKWEKPSKKSIPFAFELDHKFIAKSCIENITELVTVKKTDLDNHSGIRVLTTQSSGFNLKLTDFTYLNLFTTPDERDLSFEFIGVDSYENLTPVEITQTVTHSKQITSVKTEITGEFQVSNHIQSVQTDDYPIVTTTTEGSGEGKQNEELVTESETETISSTISVKLPAFASVQVCSIVTVAEKVKNNYNAKGWFSLPGFNGDEVASLMKKYNISYPIVSIEKHAVVAAVNGTALQNYKIGNNVIVVDFFDPNNGCEGIRRAIDIWKASKVNISTLGLEESKRILLRHFGNYFHKQ